MNDKALMHVNPDAYRTALHHSMFHDSILDTVDRNTVIVDKSPQAADPRLEETANTRSPQTQKCDIKDINEDNRQTHKTYCFQNCANVYIKPFNVHGFRKKIYADIVRVTCSLIFLFFSPLLLFSSNLAISYYSDHRPRIIDNERVLHSQPHTVSSGMWHLHHLPLNMLNMYSFL